MLASYKLKKLELILCRANNNNKSLNKLKNKLAHFCYTLPKNKEKSDFSLVAMLYYMLNVFSLLQMALKTVRMFKENYFKSRKNAMKIAPYKN